MAGAARPRAICREFGMAKRTLQRRFSKYTGVSPQQYLARVRLLQSRYLLRFTTDSVSDIAVRCGFGDVSYFSRAFRRQFGISPNQCR
ncbi:helix-turn-helix domain-containing protein [Pseudocitrobacter corydidari]|uniref:helix-turn-helix domain-containing protein n=1 Tax=Pseudocitrobacter corydidari TaxID=2891570 RepID=UPI00210664E3|nr:helix-turn-helix domain-containing protein [Pseudocitrobacter corydidari]